MARSAMIRDARNSSRRWTMVTREAMRARKSASSIAESPPPTTTISLSRKKKPSQVAQVDTPKPRRRLSLGRSSQRAEAPVEMITLLRAVLLVVDPDAEGARARSQRGVTSAASSVRAEPLGLGAHVLHQLGALDALGEARVVLDVRREHELPTRAEALDHAAATGWRARRRSPRCSRRGRRR